MIAEDNSWTGVRNGDRVAFTEMYKAYYQFLFVTGLRKCANRELAKDCIHEMFLEIWKKRQQLPAVQHVGSYLKTYLLRKILKELPKEKYSPVTTRDADTGFHGVQHSYEDLIIHVQAKEEMKQKVQRAIHQLSKREFEIIKMKFFENKSYEEIAMVTETTPRTIYNHIYNALKVLRKSLNVLFLWLFL